MMKFVALALMLSAANAACPHKCSGHGTCTVNDVCECYQNWQTGDEAGGDCSQQTCPFDIAWADVPLAEDTAHGYAECSAKGVCNRKTGLCKCFDGYTGTACQRTTCPNDCSGHGTCEYIYDMFPSGYEGSPSNTDQNFNNDFEHNLLGTLWDAKKSRMCKCDPKWTDVDCSRRMCPKGDDPLDRKAEGNCEDDESVTNWDFNDDQVQKVCFFVPNDDTNTIALMYTDLYGNKYTTKALAIDAEANVVENALKSLPDHALEDVIVSVASCTGGSLAVKKGWEVTFTGSQVSGKQPLLDVLDDPCSDGCQPKRDGIPAAGYYIVSETREADSQAFECGRRGKCDYDSGVCECFSGFTDEDCSVQSALA